MNCTIYIVYYKFVIHVTCLLAFTTYKHSELQMSATTQKLSCKASCKTPFFHSDNDLKIKLDHMELKKNSNTNKYVIYHTNSFPSELFSNLAYYVLLLLYPPC